MRWLLLVLLLLSCRTQHEKLLEDIEGHRIIDDLHIEVTNPEAAKGMRAYGFSHEYIMVFGWLEEGMSDPEACSANFDMTMHTPADIAKFVGNWCSVETQSFTEVKNGKKYYATTSICNEKQRVGLLTFEQYHDPGFAEAVFIYKNLAVGHKCVYELILRSDIMLQEN